MEAGMSNLGFPPRASSDIDTLSASISTCVLCVVLQASGPLIVVAAFLVLHLLLLSVCLLSKVCCSASTLACSAANSASCFIRLAVSVASRCLIVSVISFYLFGYSFGFQSLACASNTIRFEEAMDAPECLEKLECLEC